MIDLQQYRVLTLPGLYGSGPDHWQSRWEARHPWFERVVQDDWDTPDLPRWAGKLEQALRASDKPVLIAAHSFGCLTTVHAAARGANNIAAALMVAPADPDKFGLSEILSGRKLGFPALVLGSTTDPWMSEERASYWAGQWGAQYRCLGAVGHINAETGLGDWPEGLVMLQALV
ncbi:MAG: alpha/beta hydrolase [Burkholderiaceae bacterium]|nr:alpha/beta hydrolase [Burkholderiaceae bacterium]